MLLPYAARTVMVGLSVSCDGGMSRYLGLLAAALSRWEVAERHFHHALSWNERIQHARHFVAHTQHDYAGMLWVRNQPSDHERAHALLETAQDTAQALGMTRLNCHAARTHGKRAATIPHLSYAVSIRQCLSLR